MGEERHAHRALAGAAPFMFLLGLVAILARAQAIVTTGPWFNDSNTQAVYAITLGIAAVLTVAGAVVGIQRTWKLDDKTEMFDMRLALVRLGLEEASSAASRRQTASSAMAVDRRQAGVIVSGERRGRYPTGERSMSAPDSPEPSIAVSIEPNDVPGLYPLPNGQARERRSFRSLEVEERTLVEARNASIAAREAVWPILAGPLLLGIGFVAIGGTMLPGTGGFLTTNFRLNTMLILFLAYGWWLLIGWYGFALASLRRVGRPRRGSSEAP